MTLTQITYFEAVCEHKNVTKAANALFVSRSAVSRALKDLENEWNLVLFKRSRTGVELTEEGKIIRGMFSEFNKSYSNLKRFMNDTKRTTKNPELRIGITITTGSRFFPSFFMNFKEKYPDIRLRIIERPVYECVDSIFNGDCDFFITPYLNKKVESIEKILAYKSEMIFCVSSTHELAGRENIKIKDIAGLSRASLMDPMTINILSESLWTSSLDDNDDDEIVIKSSQQDLIQKAVASGFAAAILPREIVEKWEGVSMVSLDPINTISVYIIWDKNSWYSDTCKKFLDYIRGYDFSTLENTAV